MKLHAASVLLSAMFLSCAAETEEIKASAAPKSIAGTWRLLSGTVIENGDTTITDYTRNVSFIKIINDTHFAFLQHDLKKGKDSSAVFVAGGGTYSLRDSLYTERLEYCSAREWEGNNFSFTITMINDTLIQRGIEKIESAGVNRINIEKYMKEQ